MMAAPGDDDGGGGDGGIATKITLMLIKLKERAKKKGGKPEALRFNRIFRND